MVFRDSFVLPTLSSPDKSSIHKHLSDGLDKGAIVTLEEHEKVIFLFADMQGYAQRTKWLATHELVKLLNRIYSNFFEIIAINGALQDIEVVKLTADCIMLCACSDDPFIQKEQAKTMVKIGLLLSEYLKECNKNTSGDPINFRFGIHIGPAAKVLNNLPHGKHIDWLGEGVNLASRMEASGLPNQVQITAQMYELVKDFFECTACTHSVKSYDSPITYFAESERTCIMPRKICHKSK